MKKHFEFPAAKRNFWLCRARLPGQLVRGGSEIGGCSCCIDQIMFAGQFQVYFLDFPYLVGWGMMMVMMMTMMLMMIPHDFQGSENTSQLLVEVDGSVCFLWFWWIDFVKLVDINSHLPWHQSSSAPPVAFRWRLEKSAQRQKGEGKDGKGGTSGR